MQIITWWQAIILGLVQGLTEFIPVSSSAHLNLTHWVFNSHRNLTFDVMLHIGTLMALAFYFRHDWVNLMREPSQRKLRNLVFAACVPAAVAGAALHDAENKQALFVDPAFNATMLVVMGLLLWAADHTGRKRRELSDANWKDAVIVGCSQALALVPGVSRSGATITAGLFRRLKREDAARFSFLMSLPITLGAVGLETLKMLKTGALAATGASPGILMLGVGISAVSGFWAIGFLLNYLKNHDVRLFVFWRIGVAVVVFARILMSGADAPKPVNRETQGSHYTRFCNCASAFHVSAYNGRMRF